MRLLHQLLFFSVLSRFNVFGGKEIELFYSFKAFLYKLDARLSEFVEFFLIKKLYLEKYM